METIITVFTVLSMYFNAVSSNSSDYYYNADIENGAVKTLYVYAQQGDMLQNKLTCQFSYDANGRLVEKTVSRWDTWKNRFVPDYRLQFCYTDNGYELSHSDWNDKTQEWKNVDEKAVYTFSMDNLVSVNYLKRDHRGDFHPIDHLTISNTWNDILLAKK